MLTLFGESIGGFLCACAGGALVWHFKLTFQSWWTDAQTLANKLEADAAAFKAKAAAVKAAVK